MAELLEMEGWASDEARLERRTSFACEFSIESRSLRCLSESQRCSCRTQSNSDVEADEALAALGTSQLNASR